MSGGIDNLIPNSQRSPEELREMTRKGGIKSGETRRRKRDSRIQMLEILKCVPDLDERAIDNLKRLGMKGKGANKDKFPIEQIAYGALVQKAMKGDVRAHALIQEMIGEDAQSRRQRAQMEHEKELAAMLSAQTREDDGFLDALKGTAAEVFDSVDEPRNLEDAIE